MPKKVAVIGAGVSGLGVAWALHRHPDKFDFRLYEAQSRIGGNAITVDMPQDDGDLDTVRYFRHCVHSHGLPPYSAVHAATRDRPGRYPVQLQREVSRRRLRARFRFRHQAAVATGNREIPEAAETPEMVWPAEHLQGPGCSVPSTRSTTSVWARFSTWAGSPEISATRSSSPCSSTS